MPLMNNQTENQALLVEDRFQWQPVADYLEAHQFSACTREKIERLAIASPYALGQLQRRPELIEPLSGLTDFKLDALIIDLAEDEKIDLDQVKRQLRLYRHRKLVEIIYLDVVAANPLQSILLHLSDLADQLIRSALDICQRQLSAKHGQPTEANGEPMELNIIAMGKLGGRELNFSSDIDLICSPPRMDLFTA